MSEAARKGEQSEPDAWEDDSGCANDLYDLYDGESADCSWCGGDGWMDRSDEDPLWYLPGELHRCPSCGGSGKRKDMTLW